VVDVPPVSNVERFMSIAGTTPFAVDRFMEKTIFKIFIVLLFDPEIVNISVAADAIVKLPLVAEYVAFDGAVILLFPPNI
jgi:hypothetical protein